MTIKEAIKNNISKLRKPWWNPTAHIELYLAGNGFAGPWMKLHDCGIVQDVLFIQMDTGQADWEEYKG